GRLGRVVIEAPAGEDGVVRLDGKALGAAALGSPIPVDPGEHTVDASAPGRKAWSTAIKVDAGSATIRVRVPALEPDRVTPSTPPVPASASREEHGSGAPQRILGIGLLGAGAIGLGIGTAFGIRSLSQKSDRDQHCNGTFCDQQGVDLHESAATSATVS